MHNINRVLSLNRYLAYRHNYVVLGLRLYFMENKRFKALLEKYEKGETTSKENEALEAFFENMQKEGVEEQDVKRDLGLKNRLYADILRQIKTKHNKKINRTLVAVSAAAACIIFYFSIGNIFNPFLSENKDWITLENFEQNPKQFFLPDSSSIWLSENSTLKYPIDFNTNTRTTKLNGQAFFDITKNRQKPFSIKTGKLTTEVLGTSFNIIENDSLVEVSVCSGKVNITVENQHIDLLPNQKINYQTTTKQLIKSNTNSQLRQLWFKDEVVLDEVQLLDLVEVLEELYKTPFIFKDDEAKSVKLYSLKIKRKEPLPKLLERINFINEVQLKIKNNMVEIKKL